MALKFTYFPIIAKGPSIAVALEMSGLDWEGHFMPFEEWAGRKASTPWKELPILEVPGLGALGHEIAILSWLASKSPRLAGETEADKAASGQLLSEVEDMYKVLSQKQDTINNKGLVSKEEYASLWAAPDLTKHNRDYGYSCYLALLEDYYGKCGIGEGKFTTGGCTAGECKLWAILVIIKSLKADALDSFPGLSAFFTRFSAEKEAQAVISTGARMPGPFQPYFVPQE